MKAKAILISGMLAVVMLSFSLAASAQNQQAVTVDQGKLPALYVESDGEAHMVYDRNGTLCYATKSRNASVWQVTSLESCSNITGIAVTMTPDRTLHVLCSRYSDIWNTEKKGVLMHGKLNPSGSWSIKTIDVSRVPFGSLAVDATTDGELWLAWLRGSIHTPGRPVMIRKSLNQQWDGQECILAYSAGYKCVDLDVDGDNNLHLSTYNLQEGGILYLFRTEETAGPVEKIETEWQGSQMETLVTSVTVNSLNEPYVSYVGGHEGDNYEHLKYAWKQNGKWLYDKVDEGSTSGKAGKIIITPSGVPGFGYFHDITNPDIVRYSEKAGNSWHRTTVSECIIWNNDIQTETDLNGYVHMAWQEGAGEVRYALLPPQVLLTATPDILDFGVPALNGSRTLALTLKNISDREVTVNSIVCDDSRFAFNPSSFTIQSLGEQSVNVTFTQTSGTGTKDHITILYDGAAGKAVEVPVMVRRTGPALTTDPESLFFVEIPEEELAYDTISVTNTGNEPLLISKTELKRASSIPGMLVPTDFKLVEPNSCSELAPDESCELVVSFQPGIVSSEEYQYTYLYISSNDPEIPLRRITVSGTMAVPSIYLPETTLDLGYAPVGQTKTATLLLRNHGAEDLHVTTLALSGSNPGQFSSDVNVCSVIEGGGSCSLPVLFTPDSEGDFTATLTITSDSYSYYTKSVKVTLKGTSRERRISVTPVSVDFGHVEVDGSAEQVVTVENVGSNDLTVVGLYITGINPGEFSHNESIVTPFAPGTSFSVTVSFRPLFEGTKSARLLLESDDSDEPLLEVQLSGIAGAGNGNSISGDLWNQASTEQVSNAILRLFKQGDITAMASVHIVGTSTYTFEGVEEGSYTICAEPDQAAYPSLVPTYLGDKTTLSDASWVTVSGQLTGQDIHLLNMPAPGGGQGKIGGKMESGTKKGISVTSDPEEGKGDPVSGTRVFLKGQADGILKGYDITGSDGTFEFTGLTNGLYHFVADAAGKPMDPANPMLEISDAVREIGIIATINPQYIRIQKIATSIGNVTFNSPRIYPVPAYSSLVIEIPSGFFRIEKTTIFITDLTGKRVTAFKPFSTGDSLTTLDISGLPAGIWILEITDGEKSSIHRLIVSR